MKYDGTMKTKKLHHDFLELASRPGHLIRRLHQIHVSMFLEEFREFNLTPVQFGVLSVLYDQNILDQVSIATQIGIDRNTTADVIRRLERRGLLVRPPSTEDKRTKLAKITTEGHDLVNKAYPMMVKAQRRLVEPLNNFEYHQLMALMEKLIEANNNAGRAPWQKTFESN